MNVPPHVPTHGTIVRAATGIATADVIAAGIGIVATATVIATARAMPAQTVHVSRAAMRVLGTAHRRAVMNRGARGVATAAVAVTDAPSGRTGRIVTWSAAERRRWPLQAVPRKAAALPAHVRRMANVPTTAAALNKVRMLQRADLAKNAPNVSVANAAAAAGAGADEAGVTAARR